MGTDLQSEQSSEATGGRNRGPGDYTLAERRQGMTLILWSIALLGVFNALTTGAVFTSFLTRFLQVDDLWFGIIIAMGPAAVFAQYFGSLAAERSGRNKPKYIAFCLPQRLLWGVIALTLGLLVAIPAHIRLPLLATLFFTTAFFQHFGGGGSLAWFSALVPTQVAGRYFGFRQRISMIATLAVASSVALLIDRYDASSWVYIVLFLVASAFGLADLFIIRQVPEYPRPTGETPPTLREIVIAPWREPRFRWYAAFAFCSGVAGAMMDPFVWKYCLEPVARAGLGLSVFAVQLLMSVLPTLIMAWFAPHWGRVCDRHGPRAVLVISAIANLLLSSVWLGMRPSLVWLIPVVTLCAGVAGSGLAQVDIFMRVQGFPIFRRTTYLAALNVCNGLAITLGATLGGVIASFWAGRLATLGAHAEWLTHYHPLFLTAWLVRLAIFGLLIIRLPLPGDGGRGQALATLWHSLRKGW
jgi:MFS family permease